MGIFSRDPPRERTEPRIVAASPENPTTSLANPDAWMMDAFGIDTGMGGIATTPRSAMNTSTVFACVKLISGLIAGLPLKVWRDDADGGRTEMTDHRIADLLGGVPYPGRPLTAFTWRELWSVNTLLWGNHYSAIRYDGAGRVYGFEPMRPWNTQVFRYQSKNWYKFELEDGTNETLPFDEVLHFAGVGFDGIRGISRISFGDMPMRLARTLETQIATVHENAAKPSGMVSLPANITADGIKRMRAFYEAGITGRANAGKILWADADAKFTPFQMSPEDLNTLAFRQYQASDICGFFGVPGHLIGLTSGATTWGTGIEQITKAFLFTTMEAELQRIESELNAKLLGGTRYYVKFDRDALLAMDALTAAQVAQAEINSGLLTPNEGRRRRFRPAQPDGDNLLVNSTMIPLSRAVNPPPPPPAAPPPTDPPKPAKEPTK